MPDPVHLATSEPSRESHHTPSNTIKHTHTMQTSYLAKLHGAEFKIMRMQDAPVDAPKCDRPEATAAYLREQVKGCASFNPDVESLMVVALSARLKPIGWQVVSTGLLDQILVHAREVFKAAIVMNAHSIVLAHNHPSGDATPSDADIRCTRDLVGAGKLLRIEVLDHIILGAVTESNSKGYTSLRENGVM